MTAIADDLRALLAPRADVQLAVLLGSAARDRLRPGSDVDLAVQWRGGASGDRTGLLAALSARSGARSTWSTSSLLLPNSASRSRGTESC